VVYQAAAGTGQAFVAGNSGRGWATSATGIDDCAGGSTGPVAHGAQHQHGRGSAATIGHCSDRRNCFIHPAHAARSASPVSTGLAPQRKRRGLNGEESHPTCQETACYAKPFCANSTARKMARALFIVSS